jgi:hypothetical protein
MTILNPLILEPGTIGACKASPGIKIGNALTSPQTDRGHYFLVWQYVPEDGDYIILESIDKGVAVSRMSKYRGQGVQFFQVDCPADLRHQTPIQLTKYGEAHYDWWLIPHLAFHGVVVFIKNLIKEHKFRRLRAEELPYDINGSLICTEAIQTAYLAVGVPIIDPDIIPTPSAFKQAELDGMLIRLFFKW